MGVVRRGCLAWLVTLARSASADGIGDLAQELACDLRRGEWREYHHAYRRAAEATALAWGDEERGLSRSGLAKALRERTANISDVLSCNVGVIAGYHMLARLASPMAVESLGRFGSGQGEVGLAYRLLQLALIFIFTLRNANRVPEGPGAAWGITEHAIIPAIMQMKKGHDWQVHRRLRRKVPVSPSFRDRRLRIAVVSICAYPPNHTLALPKVTPKNREAYTRRHGYDLRLHMEPPIIGAHGLGVQHAKLATVLAYMQSGEFDWIAWLDCDSIIMNMDRTLDSIIYQYAQRRDAPESGDVAPAVCGETGGFPDISGEWLDSFVPPELQDEAAVRISQTDGSLSATAQQFGEAAGSLEEDGSLQLGFDAGALRGRVVRELGAVTRLEFENGAVWTRPQGAGPCREPCTEVGGCAAELDPGVDLLVTEEGWGLSSANWLIRRSKWSLDFLMAALTAAHVDMRLFGDQDAIILHLMNEQALTAAARADSAALAGDPLDGHAAVVPQFELNSYDALNALTMDCDAFVEGDLLVTFPQCKDAEGCNDVFNLAADYAGDDAKPPAEPHAGAWWLRREGRPRWPGYTTRSSAAIRVFGPRPVIREIFLREQQMIP